MTSPSSSQPDLRQKRILVVEDELMIRMLLEDMLAELGCTIAAEATHIKDALEAVRNADFDVAIRLRHRLWRAGNARIPSRATNVEEAVSA